MKKPINQVKQILNTPEQLSLFLVEHHIFSDEPNWEEQELIFAFYELGKNSENLFELLEFLENPFDEF